MWLERRRQSPPPSAVCARSDPLVLRPETSSLVLASLGWMSISVTPTGTGRMTRDFPAGNYRFIPAVFQYSSGAAAVLRLRDRARALRQAKAAGRGICAGCELYPGGRAAADVVLCLRAALAGGVYRGRVSNFQRALRQDARGMGVVRWRHQSGGAQQRLSGDRSAGRAVVLCLLLHAAEARARRRAS